MAVEKQEGQIASAVNSLVRQRELTRVATSARSLVVAAGILLVTLGVGALMEWMGLLWFQGGFAPLKAVRLTQEQAEALPRQLALLLSELFNNRYKHWRIDYARECIYTLDGGHEYWIGFETLQTDVQKQEWIQRLSYKNWSSPKMLAELTEILESTFSASK